MTWRASVLTLFPAMFPGPLGLSLAGRALTTGIWSLETVNIRDFATDRHRASMTPRSAAAPAWCCGRTWSTPPGRLGAPTTVRCVCLTPRGRPFTQADAGARRRPRRRSCSCGRYEGVDQRVIEPAPWRKSASATTCCPAANSRPWSLLDACVRLLPGVMGAADSADRGKFLRRPAGIPALHPPRRVAGPPVPDVLLSGHHAAVAAWRRAEAERITRDRRPDLWAARLGHTPAPVATAPAP